MKMSVLPLLRQFMVIISPLFATFSVGGAVTFPSLLMQQQTLENSSIHVNVDTKSWIGSIYGLTGIPAVFMPIIAQRYGRKFGYLLACSYLVLGWILILLANSKALIFASESFNGLASNCLVPIITLTITEMLSPKYRVLFIQLASVTMCLGMATGGILGRFCSYKTVSLIMLVPAVLAMVIGVMWPESPPWLAWKGEFAKCKRNFIWLRGKDENSNKELTELLMAQRENLIITKSNNKNTIKLFLSNITSRDFYMPSFHIFILMSFMYWSGGDVVLIYFIDMVNKSTDNENAVSYSSIIMYAIVFCGAVITNILVTRLKNKTVLMFSASGVALSLISALFASALQSAGLIPKDSLICMYILLVYTIFNSLGMNAFVFIIGSELMPVKHRSLGGAVYIISNCVLYTSTQKISPYLLLYLDMWCTFLIFTLNILFCGWFVWRYVPETKGRTLQEIEEFYVHGRFIKRTALNEIQDDLEV